jgi:hypothetical protein
MLIWVGGVRFLVEFMRIGNWRLGDIPTAQLFGAAFVLVGLGIMAYRRRTHAPRLAPAAAAPASDALRDADLDHDEDAFEGELDDLDDVDDELDDDMDDELGEVPGTAAHPSRPPRPAAPGAGPPPLNPQAQR